MSRRLSRRGCFFPVEVKTETNMKRLKSSWEEYDLVNNPDGDVIGTPPDMRTFVERTARFVAKNGLDFEKSIMNNNLLNDAGLNVNFLTRSADPFHGYYKEKLSEYLSHQNDQQQENEDNNIQPDVTEISKRSDPFHEFYWQNLTKYRSQNQEDGANQDAPTDSRPDLIVDPQISNLPSFRTIRLAKEMNHKEFVTMKLTAQFLVWYGLGFLMKLKEKGGFEFTSQTDSRFPCFSQFVYEYSKKDLRDKLPKIDDAYMAAILDGFYCLLECDALGEMKWQEGELHSMIDWHASLEKKLASEELPLGTSTRPPLPLSEEPEPKKQRFDEPADQFLAQHPVSKLKKPDF